MRRLKRFKTFVGVAVVTAPAAMLALSIGTAAVQPSPSPSSSPPPNLRGATKVAIDNTKRDCNGVAHSDHGSGSGSGFAVINTAGDKNVIAVVNLTNAAPNATYNVRLIQTPSAGPGSVNDCTGVGATLHTDASGNGSVNVHEPLLPGATNAFVLLNNLDTADYYTSPDVTLSIPPSDATTVTIGNTGRDCDGLAQSDHGSGSGSGFAVINTAGHKNVIAVVNLTNAAPNATYNVRLIETRQGSPCTVNPANGVYGVTLHTDASGNGSVNIQGPLLSGKNGAFVDLNSTTAPYRDFYTSPVVTFSD